MKKIFPPLTHFNAANMTTSLSIVMGILAFIQIKEGSLMIGLIFFATTLILDRLDGLVARILKQQSNFGKELDSLADAFSFAILPALITLLLGLNAWYMILLYILYALAGVWRLGHYNITKEEGKVTHYTGFPTTTIGALFFIISALGQILNISLSPLYLAFFITAPLLMLCGFKYKKEGIITWSLTGGAVILLIILIIRVITN